MLCFEVFEDLLETLRVLWVLLGRGVFQGFVVVEDDEGLGLLVGFYFDEIHLSGQFVYLFHFWDIINYNIKLNLNY